MGLTGKYDFAGIKKFGAAGIKAALSSTPWGAWLVSKWMEPITDILLGWAINWLANEGLIVLNVGAIAVSGDWDQKAFDSALSDGLRKVELSGGKLTEAERKKIDDEVIKAARRFIIITRPDDRVSHDADVGLRSDGTSSRI